MILNECEIISNFLLIYLKEEKELENVYIYFNQDKSYLEKKDLFLNIFVKGKNIKKKHLEKIVKNLYIKLPNIKEYTIIEKYIILKLNHNIDINTEW